MTIVPRNTGEPTGTAKRVAGADRDFNRRLNVLFKEMKAVVKDLNPKRTQVNHKFVVMNQLNLNKAWHMTDNGEHQGIKKRELRVNEFIYDYDLNPDDLLRLNQIITEIVDRLFMTDRQGNVVRTDNGRQLWFMEAYVEPAYQQGYAQAHANMSSQSSIYAAAAVSPAELRYSSPYQRRIGLLAAKEFSVLTDFSEKMKYDLKLILGDAIAIGKSPRDVIDEISSRVGVAKSRAKRISQTEIPGALRIARRQEMEWANIEMFAGTDFVMKLLHMSAFKSTSRPEHIARSGKIYTKQEVDEWYSIVPNMISCYCTQIEVLVDRKTGKPVSDGAQKKVLKLKEDYKE